MCAVCATAAAECKEPHDCRRTTASPAGLWHTGMSGAPTCAGPNAAAAPAEDSSSAHDSTKSQNNAAKEQVRNRVRVCKVLASTGTQARTHTCCSTARAAGPPALRPTTLQLVCTGQYTATAATAVAAQSSVRVQQPGSQGSKRRSLGTQGKHNTAPFQKCAASAH